MRSLIASLIFVAGCTVGAPAGQDLTSPAPDATEPVDPRRCTLAQEACRSNERTYSSSTACTSAGEDACRRIAGVCGGSDSFCGSQTAQCLAYPACDTGDSQVTACAKDAICYQRTTCGTTITCQKPRLVNCDAYPACDAGDEQVTDTTTCTKSGIDCYSRTACGTTIWCVNY